VIWQRPAEAQSPARGKIPCAPATGKASLSPLEKYAQVLLLSNELMFVD